MGQKHLRTVVNGCAWCKSLIGIKTHEVESCTQDKPLVLSHGLCIPCKETLEVDLEGSEGSEDSSEPELELIPV